MICKVVSLLGHFPVDYGELLGIIEGYVIVESDSLRIVNNFNSHEEDLSELGVLATYFLDNICLTSTSFSHICRFGNSQTHLLTKITLNTEVPKNISSDIVHVILFLQ